MSLVAPAPRFFEAGAVRLQSGVMLDPCRIGYVTYGTLNAARDNVIVWPTRYGATSAENTYLIGAGLALDPVHWFIVVPDQLGDGVSSSPSNQPAPQDGPRFPKVTHLDNVRLQRRLLAEVFGVERVRLVVGWSMGGQQAYHWGALFPDQVDAIACLNGQAITAPHTYVFLEGVKHALTADAAFAGGDYKTPPYAGLKAKGRVWAGWALSQAWYREGHFRALGFDSAEAYLAGVWDQIYVKRDANDLLSMIATWQACNIADNDLYGGDIAAALGAIKARALIMPCRTDFYFPPEDNAREVARMPNAELRLVESVWGHLSGGGRHPPDTAIYDAALKDLLARAA
jgi:homoserine O-acetyltransferase